MFSAFKNGLNNLRRKLQARHSERVLSRRNIDEALWQNCIQRLHFLQHLPPSDLQHLRTLTSYFLDQKEFSGAQGLTVTDEMAVMVAIQACLPILHIAPRERPGDALAWYEGFFGIVLHPGEVRARRQWVDEDGIEHRGFEDLTGEALEGGPLMLAYSDVAQAGDLAQRAYNLVIHEFIHVIDLRDGIADGCPALPPLQRATWMEALQTEYALFCEASELYERFGDRSPQPKPLLDAYGRSSLTEFFAVAAEAYFTQRSAFEEQHALLFKPFEQFFRRHA